MSIDEQTVLKAARLARLAITNEEAHTRMGDLNGILKWIEQLDEVDTDGVEPLANVADITLNLREDIVNDGGDVSKVLANAPDSTQDFYVVPKVVDTDA